VSPAGVSSHLRDDVDWNEVAMPFRFRHPEVERIRDIRYDACAAST